MFAPAGAPVFMLYNAQAGGAITPLGDARGGSQQGYTYDPQHISGNGQIVGYMGSQYVLVSGGQVTNLPGWGQAVNDSGQVAYQTGPLSGVQTSSISSNGTSTSLGTVPGYEGTYVSGINNSGQVAAMVSHDLTGPNNDFRSQPAFYNGHKLIPLGTFGGTYGYAIGINNQGDVIGSAENASGALIGFVSHNGGPLINLGSLAGDVESKPESINDSGQIVGTTPGLGKAFLYQNGTLTDLNKLLSASVSNINLLDAYAINNAGQIVAEGIAKGSSGPQLLLLTPDGQPVPPSPDPLIQTDPVSTPEPGMLAIFGLMISGMAVRRRGRRPSCPSRAGRH